MRMRSAVLLLLLLLLEGCTRTLPEATRRSVEKERAMRAAEDSALRSGTHPRYPRPPRALAPPVPPPCDRLHEDCPHGSSMPEPFAHERASQEQMLREDAVPKPRRDGDSERHKHDKSLSDGWRKLDDKLHGWRDGQFGEVDEPDGPWADGDEPPKDYHMCKKRYEDVFGQSRVLHSLCSWWAKGVLCEKIADAYTCKRYMGDYFYSDRRFHEFGDLCSEHCLHGAEDDFASMFSTRGNDASAQIHSWRSTKRKPPEATTRPPLSAAERKQLGRQPRIGSVDRESAERAGTERGNTERARQGGSDKEAELKERVFAQLHQKLHRQKEEEREAQAVLEEEEAAAVQEEGEAGGEAVPAEDTVMLHTHGGERRAQGQMPRLQQTSQATILGSRSVPSTSEPEGVTKLREAVLRRSKESKPSSQGSTKRARASRQRRLEQQDAPVIPPVPFMHERASQAKIARENAKGKAKAETTNDKVAAAAAAGAAEATQRWRGNDEALHVDEAPAMIAAAAFDPLYGPW